MTSTLQPPGALEEFYSQVDRFHMKPLWLQQDGLSEPDHVVKPMLWRWQEIRSAMIRAGELMPVGSDDAERRVLTLQNPTIPAKRGSTRTLQAAVQMIFGGERAPSHRHTIAAIRFILEGSGAATIVDGEPLVMEPGDFLLTPNWTWHGHTKETDGPMFWLDVLDAPFIRNMNWVFFEGFPGGGVQLAEKPRDDSLRRFGRGGLRPLTHDSNGKAYSPLFTYKWTDARAALDRIADAEVSPFDGRAIRYVNPVTGGPVMPTMDACLQLLRRGERTRAHRHTSNVIYCVAEGAGASTIAGERFAWSKGDVFCVPGWSAHCHEASAEGPAVLFSISDVPVLEALDLYREAVVE